MRTDAAVAQFAKAVSLPAYIEVQPQDAAADLEKGHELFTAQEVITDAQGAAASIAFSPDEIHVNTDLRLLA